MIPEGNLVLMPQDCALLVRQLNNDPMDTLTGGEKDRYEELLYSLRESAKLSPVSLNGDKVWGGSPMWRRSIIDDGTTHNQCRTIVRAKNKAEAMRLLNAASLSIGPSHFSNFWSVSGNRRELSLVVERGVWAKGKDAWIRLK